MNEEKVTVMWCGEAWEGVVLQRLQKNKVKVRLRKPGSSVSHSVTVEAWQIATDSEEKI